MRGKCAAAVLGTVAVLVLAGCGGPSPRGGGALADGWSRMPEPTPSVPADHACYDVERPSPGAATLPPAVDCGARHTLETVHVGAFTGADAAAGAPPPVGAAARQRAYADCVAAVTNWTGGDWRTGRLGLDVAVAPAAQWAAGSRWYRCDLVEFADLTTYTVVGRVGTLKGALGGTRPVALACFAVTAKGKQVASMSPVDCQSAHNGEFAGIWEAPPGAYPTDAGQREKAQLDGCRTVIASFTGLPVDDRLRYRVGQIAYAFGRADWELGNRGARCYLWVDNKTFTTSLKGAGAAALPVNAA
ncbi:septum formation family protein [Planosporangium sp. 12N6]|uniref:septum formation family protein n=1 Tax=Planosporangium spinosum TaxID=3402278 RepID=UPI003CF7ADA0